MRLHNKLFITFSLIIAITLVVVFIYLDHGLNRDSLAQLKDTIKKQTNVCKIILLETDIKKYPLEKLSQQIGSSLGLRVTFISINGSILGDSDVPDKELGKLENHIGRPEIQDAIKYGEGWSQRFSTTLKKNIMYYAVPVRAQQFNGFIRLSIPVEKVSLMSKNIDDVLMFSLLIAFIASLVMALVAFNIISRPIRILAKRAQAIANGDFSSKLLVNKKDEVGELAMSLNTMSDNITSRINDILNNNSKFETVLLSMSDGVMVLDPNGFIQLMNNTLKDMLDINVDPIGKKPIEVIRNINVQNMSEEVFKMKTGVITREEKIIFPYNKTILIHATPVKIEQKIFGAVIVFSDITELRRLETIRTDFVANVSHELRTPVSNIRGYAETLLDGAIDDKKNAHDFTKIIYNESGRLASLINDILDLSKIESDTFKLNLGQHNLYEIVNKAINKLGKDAGNKNIVVDNVVNKELNFNVDESLLTQVLINLLHNAIKYSHENSKITVSSNIQQGLVTVDVEDQGIGIPERDLPRIFERFYRVDKARSKELGGTGLGLAIVKHIIQVHGGEVSVKSVEGQGSVFSFTIPQKHRR